jgi:hypothetical protein
MPMPARLRAMPFDVDAWFLESDAACLSLEQEAALFRLLCYAWKRRPPCCLLDDDRLLASFSGLSIRRWPRVGQPLKTFFELVDGRYMRNERQFKQYCRLAVSRPSGVRAKLLDKFGPRCFYCQTEEGPFHIEHMLPIARGGTSDFSNLTLACVPCNLSKGKLTAAEFIDAVSRGLRRPSLRAEVN